MKLQNMNDKEIFEQHFKTSELLTDNNEEYVKLYQEKRKIHSKILSNRQVKTDIEKAIYDIVKSMQKRRKVR